MYLRILTILLCIFPGISNAMCLYEPLTKSLDSASIVFIATLVSGEVSGPLEALKNGELYRTDYTFIVRERIKGDPSLVPKIYSTATYNDPLADVYWDASETRLIPGDNVLVIAKGPGDVEVDFCGPSVPWNKGSEELRTYRARHAL